jgi:hypothetical protein
MAVTALVPMEETAVLLTVAVFNVPLTSPAAVRPDASTTALAPVTLPTPALLAAVKANAAPVIESVATPVLLAAVLLIALLIPERVATPAADRSAPTMVVPAVRVKCGIY